MKKWNFILGVDVSKLTLDVHCAELNMIPGSVTALKDLSCCTNGVKTRE
jgi:hypothetical protein